MLSNTFHTRGKVGRLPLHAGKYFGVRADVAMLGLDRSQGLAAAAARRLPAHSVACSPSPARCADVAVADALALPLRSCACDAVLCVVSASPQRFSCLAPDARRTAFPKSKVKVATSLAILYLICISGAMPRYASTPCLIASPSGLKRGGVGFEACMHAVQLPSRPGNPLCWALT